MEVYIPTLQLRVLCAPAEGNRLIKTGKKTAIQLKTRATTDDFYSI